MCRTIFCLLFTACTLAADDKRDLSALVEAIKTVMLKGPEAARLSFTADFQESSSVLSGWRESRPMSEKSGPIFATETIRIVTPQVAVIDLPVNQYGSLTMRRVNLTFIVRKDGPDWKIFSIRMQPACDLLL